MCVSVLKHVDRSICPCVNFSVCMCRNEHAWALHSWYAWMHSAVGSWSLDNNSLACMLHKSTRRGGKKNAVSSTAGPLCHCCSRQTWGLCSFVVGGRARRGPRASPPLLSSFRRPPHANIHHMRGVMPRSSVLPLMIPSMPTMGSVCQARCLLSSLNFYLVFMAQWKKKEGRQWLHPVRLFTALHIFLLALMIFLCGTVFALKL